ncbi:MAG: pentapeptide repeat-containing protein [Gemmatimonadales bacterium]|nr:pentapeptide repeat-containing protein [Gemmatimonadales bacterium]
MSPHSPSAKGTGPLQSKTVLWRSDQGRSHRSDLTGANLSRAVFDGGWRGPAVLTGANLTGASFARTKLCSPSGQTI